MKTSLMLKTNKQIYSFVTLHDNFKMFYKFIFLCFYWVYFTRSSLVTLATPICFIRGLSIYLSVTNFYLREEKEAKVVGVTGDEDIADTKSKQRNIFICNFT